MGHTSQEDLAKKIETANIKVGEKYYHFKNPNDLYTIEFVGLLENTEEVCVGYRGDYGKKLLWVRTISDFFSEKEIDGKKVKRFTKVN